MFELTLSTTVSFLITFFAIPVIIQVAKEKKLFDEPGERKIHKRVIPTLGGLGIFAGFLISFLLTSPYQGHFDIQYTTAAMLVIFFLGIKDDIVVLSASKKFIGQLFASLILVTMGGVYIDNMHGFLGIYELPTWASISLSVFTLLVITNSFNLIDGIDGLAGSLGVIACFFTGSYFFLNGEPGLAVMGFALLGSLVAFLYYNISPAKIFMGDTGSLLIGMINSILIIEFINYAPSPSSIYSIQASPAIGFAIVMMQLIDTLQVFFVRLLNRKSPFKPDRNHIHHYLLDLGFSHKKSCLIIASLNVMFIAMSLSLSHLGTSVVIGVLLGVGLTITSLIYSIRQRTIRNRENAGSNNAEIISPAGIFTFVPTADPLEME
jgi:UDP-N-acetylmuramyl pentapeptide phosphotransferase/UDP-N-acetylglucosamine-1-phosphate transferase